MSAHKDGTIINNNPPLFIRRKLSAKSGVVMRHSNI